MADETPAWLKALSHSRGELISDKDLDKLFRQERHKQDHSLRYCLFWCVVALMVLEVAFVFVIITLQGFGPWGFHLNDWVLTFLQVGVLAQTFGLAKIITIHLFPRTKH